MKQTIAYYLFIIYACAIFKPLILIACDVWSHEFDEVEHIATIHAKYGNNHLEIAMGNTTNDTNKNQNSIKSEEASTVHLVPQLKLYNPYHNSILAVCYACLPPQKLDGGFLFLQSPPPKYGTSLFI